MWVSVIIPCLNAANTIAHQLDALAKQDCKKPWEVIVSDNGSTDESLAIVEQYKDRLPNLRIVDSSDRRGAAHARNIGAKAASGEVLAFCDSDDEVSPGWVAAMAEALRNCDFVAGAFEMNKLNPSWLQPSHPQEKGLNKFNYPPYLHHAGGGNLGIKRAVHEMVGGFDETVPILEDTDYCFRNQLNGVQLCFVPDAIIHIRSFQNLADIFRKATKVGENHVLLYKKYRPLGMPKISWKSGLFGWMQLLKSMVRIRNKRNLANCLWSLGWRLGRIKGCIKHRVFAL
jgi:glycosyltransferase involved in cell wall biosynthesis